MKDPKIVKHNELLERHGLPPQRADSLEDYMQSNDNKDGDDRTPDKKIGEVKYAELPKDKASAPKEPVAPKSPEKQGGIGGP
jgi:hypothetical protein